MAQGKHIGKVLIRVKNETQIMSVVARYVLTKCVCSAKTYITKNSEFLQISDIIYILIYLEDH